MNRFWVALTLVGCIGETKSDTATDPTDTTEECEILPDTSCAPDTAGATYADCPEGYTCSGPSAYSCYRGFCPDLPECLPAAARIDTPNGEVRVDQLAPGDLVWTLRGGAPAVEPVLFVRSRDVPASHVVMAIRLDDGRALTASPGHPTADGRFLGDLRPGDRLDGAVVTRAERVLYGQPRTWDLLPAGPTGAYRADGVWVGSTLAR